MKIKTMLALLAAGGLVVGCAESPQLQAFNNTKSPYMETTRDEASCGVSTNVWAARFVVQGTHDAPAHAVEACFKTRKACHQWLEQANNYDSNGQIIEDSCRKSS